MCLLPYDSLFSLPRQCHQTGLVSLYRARGERFTFQAKDLERGCLSLVELVFMPSLQNHIISLLRPSQIKWSATNFLPFAAIFSFFFRPSFLLVHFQHNLLNVAIFLSHVGKNCVIRALDRMREDEEHDGKIDREAAVEKPAKGLWRERLMHDFDTSSSLPPPHPQIQWAPYQPKGFEGLSSFIKRPSHTTLCVQQQMAFQSSVSVCP